MSHGVRTLSYEVTAAGLGRVLGSAAEMQVRLDVKALRLICQHPANRGATPGPNVWFRAGTWGCHQDAHGLRCVRSELSCRAGWSYTKPNIRLIQGQIWGQTVTPHLRENSSCWVMHLGPRAATDEVPGTQTVTQPHSGNAFTSKIARRSRQVAKSKRPRDQDSIRMQLVRLRHCSFLQAYNLLQFLPCRRTQRNR